MYKIKYICVMHLSTVFFVRYNRRERYDRNRDFDRGGRELDRPPREEEYEEERPRRGYISICVTRNLINAKF